MDENEFYSGFDEEFEKMMQTYYDERNRRHEEKASTSKVKNKKEQNVSVPDEKVNISTPIVESIKKASKSPVEVEKKEIIKKAEEKRKDVTSIAKKIERKVSEKRKIRKDKKIINQINKNLAHQTRFTEPKKRNLLSRIILQSRLEKHAYEDIEDEYNYFTQAEIDESKNADKRKDRRFYKEVQEYEDAKEDITVRKGWRAFRVGLAAAMLAGSLAISSYLSKEVKSTLFNYNQTQATSIDNIQKEDEEHYENLINEFLNQVREKDGYEFDYLSKNEILDAYLKIVNKEKYMTEGQFKGAINSFKDQELLDKIVIRSLGEEEYTLFSENQKRDYRQLAYELLPISLPKVFNEEKIMYIRNPITYDVVQAKNSSKSKGYKIEIVVNSDKTEEMKNVSKLMRIEKALPEEEYINASKINDGQELLENILKQTFDEEYDNLSKKEKRDYKQLAYELLSEDVKENYIKDPIDIEKETKDFELGD